MIFAVEWLALHLFGVVVAFALLLIVSRKEDTSYKSELILTIACCLVTLTSKSFYIMGGSKETLLALGKLEYLGKCFGNFCALMFCSAGGISRLRYGLSIRFFLPMSHFTS